MHQLMWALLLALGRIDRACGALWQGGWGALTCVEQGATTLGRIDRKSPVIGYNAVLEIPTGPPVLGRQLWRRTGNFLLIFLQSYVYDLKFKT